ncbi:type II toxin-antitoxin system VapC family toxin [Halorutilales archaeon Cl-col2-1]
MEDRFAPKTDSPEPLFLDTSGLFPYFDPGTKEHEEVNLFFKEMLPDLPYRPLYTNQYVVDELVTLLLYKADREKAEKAYESITQSEAIQLLSVDDSVFEQAGESFLQENEAVSFTDHTVGIHADEKGISYILAYDGDFERLGMNKIPR